MDPELPVSKREFDAGLAATQANLDAKIDATRVEILERMEKMQTALLTAFHGFSVSVSARFQTHDTQLKAHDVMHSALSDRTTALEERMINLEAWRRIK